jgi:hypothetical protein
MGMVKTKMIEDALDALNRSMTTFNPNNDPVYSIPLSELVNLWRARYVDTWIDVSEIEEEFWSDAYARLNTNKKSRNWSRNTAIQWCSAW